MLHPWLQPDPMSPLSLRDPTSPGKVGAKVDRAKTSRRSRLSPAYMFGLILKAALILITKVSC